MGYPIMFYIRDDIRENLKSIPNRSELINQLLSEHFKSISLDNLTLEEREKILLEKKRVALIELKAFEEINNATI